MIRIGREAVTAESRYVQDGASEAAPRPATWRARRKMAHLGFSGPQAGDEGLLRDRSSTRFSQAQAQALIT